MSTDELPKKAVQALRLRLQHVKNHLEPIFSKPLNDISAKLTMTEKYELQVLLSYSLNTLFYSKNNTKTLFFIFYFWKPTSFYIVVYLRINGSDPQKHAVMTELVREEKMRMKETIDTICIETSTKIHHKVEDLPRKRRQT